MEQEEEKKEGVEIEYVWESSLFFFWQLLRSRQLIALGQRGFFDQEKRIEVPQHGFEIWPGVKVWRSVVIVIIYSLLLLFFIYCCSLA